MMILSIFSFIFFFFFAMYIVYKLFCLYYNNCTIKDECKKNYERSQYKFIEKDLNKLFNKYK